jgi:hypothetical protein
VPAASSSAATCAASVLRGFHLMIQSTCGYPEAFIDSMHAIKAEEST